MIGNELYILFQYLSYFLAVQRYKDTWQDNSVIKMSKNVKFQN